MSEKIKAIIEKAKNTLPFFKRNKILSAISILLVIVFITSVRGCCSWRSKYKKLSISYNELSDSYSNIEAEHNSLKTIYNNLLNQLTTEATTETATEVTTETATKTTTENPDEERQVELLQLYFDCVDNINTYTYESIINNLQTMADTKGYTLDITGEEDAEVYLYNTNENYLYCVFCAIIDDNGEYLPQSQDRIGFMYYYLDSDAYLYCGNLSRIELFTHDSSKTKSSEVADTSEQLDFIKKKSDVFKDMELKTTVISGTEKEEALKKTIINVVGNGNLKTINYVPANDFTLIEFESPNSSTISGMYSDILKVLEAIQPTIDTDVDINVYCPLSDKYGNSESYKVIAATFTYETIQKINYENIDTENIPTIADEWWTHPSLRN